MQKGIPVENTRFMKRALELSEESMRLGGGPFGAVIVKDGKIIGEGMNRVVPLNDPTAHAEVVAIREACHKLATFDLSGAVVFASCEPCPMCLGAIYWARPKAIYYANTKADAAAIDFEDAFIYAEIERPISERQLFTQQLMRDEALIAFKKWKSSPLKTDY